MLMVAKNKKQKQLTLKTFLFLQVKCRIPSEAIEKIEIANEIKTGSILMI